MRHRPGDPTGDEVAPGEQRRVHIRFLSGGGLRELLWVGREWRIREGLRPVAYGRILELLSSPHAAPNDRGRLLYWSASERSDCTHGAGGAGQRPPLANDWFGGGFSQQTVTNCCASG